MLETIQALQLITLKNFPFKFFHDGQVCSVQESNLIGLIHFLRGQSVKHGWCGQLQNSFFQTSEGSKATLNFNHTFLLTWNLNFAVSNFAKVWGCETTWKPRWLGHSYYPLFSIFLAIEFIQKLANYFFEIMKIINIFALILAKTSNFFKSLAWIK